MWNYRIFKQVYEPTQEVHYGIKEAFYNDDNEVDSWTVDDMKPFGETPEELREHINMMLQAFGRPVIDENKRLEEIEVKNKIDESIIIESLKNNVK
jgi:hypothetical protein